jgi:hypothetical protein
MMGERAGVNAHQCVLALLPSPDACHRTEVEDQRVSSGGRLLSLFVSQQRRYVGAVEEVSAHRLSNAETSSFHSGYENVVDSRSERSDDISNAQLRRAGSGEGWGEDAVAAVPDAIFPDGIAEGEPI